MADVTADVDGVELREIHGPSAIGGGVKRFLELLWLVAASDFKKTYFGTILGYLWSFIRPLALFGVLLFVFTRIFRLSYVPHYQVLLLFNIVLFGFFQEATINALSSVVNRESVVRKTQFPRLVIPLATVLTSLLNFATNMLVVLGFLLAFGVDPMPTWLFFPLIVLLVLIFTTAVAMLLATLYVRYRDVAVIWGVMVTAIIYGTPVIYPLQDPPVPHQYLHVLLINPLTPIFVQARSWIIDRSAPGALATAGGWGWLVPSMVLYAAICAFAIWKFNRDAPFVAEQL